MLQRDVFIEEIIKKLSSDDSIYFLSADFGAKSLDLLREKYPKNFIHCGISEQAMLDIATGLALEKNKVFVYAMAPFLSLRAIEQAKCGPGLMRLPISIISVGIGLGYADAGPTHYANEDFSCMRTIIGNSIFTPSDNDTTKFIAKDLISNPKFAYVRLDRDELPNLKPALTETEFKDGFKVFGEISNEKKILISHGKIFHNCYNILKDKNNEFICINLFRSKPFPKKLLKLLNSSHKIVVVDEQSPGGNLGSCVFESLGDENIFPKIKTLSLNNEYVFENGGRSYLLNKYGLSDDDIFESLRKI
tara:strand:- start:1331 stop:2245 length:915 start_codon:yes stop_codon:yes gene_type:complete